MTTINTSEDLLRLLREDPHFYEQARRLILTDELITLPERFAAFAARVDDFIAKQEQFNDEQRQFNQRVDSRFDRIEREHSHFKNRFSESQVAEEAFTIAMAMGFTLVRVLSNSDLVQMCQHPAARPLAQNDLVSFTRSDLVLEVSDEEGSRQFISVEISYTADLRDTDRLSATPTTSPGSPDNPPMPPSPARATTTTYRASSTEEPSGGTRWKIRPMEPRASR